jgi:integrase/recombinase XerD
LREWIAGMSRAGMAPSSVSRSVSAARGFFRFLMLDGHVKRHPAEDIHTPQQSSRLPKFLSEEEMERCCSPRISKLIWVCEIGLCWN